MATLNFLQYFSKDINIVRLADTIDTAQNAITLTPERRIEFQSYYSYFKPTRGGYQIGYWRYDSRKHYEYAPIQRTRPRARGAGRVRDLTPDVQFFEIHRRIGAIINASATMKELAGWPSDYDCEMSADSSTDVEMGMDNPAP